MVGGRLSSIAILLEVFLRALASSFGEDPKWIIILEMGWLFFKCCYPLWRFSSVNIFTLRERLWGHTASLQKYSHDSNHMGVHTAPKKGAPQQPFSVGALLASRS